MSKRLYKIRKGVDVFERVECGTIASETELSSLVHYSHVFALYQGNVLIESITEIARGILEKADDEMTTERGGTGCVAITAK